ncbi:MAG: hypothetical protein GY702_06705 [Desulfobulbaceae bacterium]|nr:hypothetical protein [Desulfobulbaceae bacterium]
MKRLLSIFIVTSLLLATPLIAGSVSKMNKEELKTLLGSDDLVVLDVRTGRDWSTSEFKIQSAVRADGRDLSVANNYTIDHTFVLYCA